MKKIICKYIFFIVLLIFLGSCKKQIEVNAPITSLTDENIYASDKIASGVLTGIYADLSSNNSAFQDPALSNISLHAGLSGDELILFDLNNITLIPYYINDLRGTESNDFWSYIYSMVFRCNAAIDGLTLSTTLTHGVKQQLLGEAKFMRAFFYFYLINLYGDVPLALSTDYRLNAVLSRIKASQVYEQIISDLKDAQNMLSTDYVDSDVLKSSLERVRPSKGAATALLARAYLYMTDYVNAEVEASKVISNIALYDTVSLSNVFLANSNETIWALQPVGLASELAANTGDGLCFILPDAGPDDIAYPVYLSENIMNAFEPGDMRKKNWTSDVVTGGTIYNYAYKYKVGASNTSTKEYTVLMRLAEVYLIRAEARANLNNLTGAAEDINIVRIRAGLLAINNSTKDLMLNAILHERQVELFTEMGHRWFDLKRTGKIDNVMQGIAESKSGLGWNPEKALFPIPQLEISNNVNLRGHQNPGYQE
jgi:hypothetical protein